jgi:hypothetical protein
VKYSKTFAEAYQNIYENAAAREIDAYADKLGRSSMDYRMFKKSADLLKKKDFKALGKHIHGSDTSPREYVMSVMNKKDPASFKKIYGNQTGFLATMKPIGLKEEDDHEVSMAIGQVKVMQERLSTIMSFLSSKGDDYNIEGWVQSYITSAEESLTTIADYLDKNPKVQKEEKLQEQEEPIKKEQPKKDTDALEKQIITLQGQLNVTKQKLENEKNKVAKPEPNPETGEIPLRTGLANAILSIKDNKKAEINKSKQTSKQIRSLTKESSDIIRESDASDKAKSMGLDYMSFGRYGKKGKVTHKSMGGTLTAVDKDEKPIKEPEPKSDEPKKSDDGKVKEVDTQAKSREFLRSLEAGKIEDDDGVIELDFDDEMSFDPAIEKARSMGLDDLANDLDSVAGRVMEYEIDKAQAEYQDVIAKYSGKEIEAVVQSKNADKAIDLMTDQEYSASNVKNMVTDLKSTFDVIQKMVDSDKTDGEAGGGNSNPKKGFRPEVIDTLKSLEDISDSIEVVKDELDDEDMKSKLDMIQGEIEFITDDSADHDGYTKSSKVNGAVESIRDMLKDLSKPVKEQFMSFRRKMMREEEEGETVLTDKDLTKKPELKDILAVKKKEKKIKVGGQSKIEVNPKADIGQYSGGTKVNTGNLH